ncbi:MAG: double-strand break repair Rad50 ATPase, partial [Labilithrix sp.]|nr:double-strand break repair Rad50 ATPase [Labilithrix sp.]
EALGEPAGTHARPLAELVDLASVRRSRADAARQASAASASAVAKLEAQLEERRQSIARDEAVLDETRARLAELLTPLGLGEEADADEVTRAIDALRELFALDDERAQHEAALVAATEAIAAFEEQAASTAAAVAPDLVGLPAADAARELVARRARALAAAEQLADAEQQLAEMHEADVPPEIAALAASPELAAQAVEEADARLDELDERVRTETQLVARLEVGLEQLRGDSGAAESAARAQEALARARAELERYVRARAAATLLSREIERYRAENQGPLLTKASELFARLTLGHFEGVRAGYDDKDKAALRCVRRGVEVDVAGLSEGTRDQLHLGLRLASLLRYAELADPMPLVLDDLLVQFDDERSQAALTVIGEVAGHMQVLFFTHHARMVDLARAAIPAASLTVHELPGPVGSAASAAPDPSARETGFA